MLFEEQIKSVIRQTRRSLPSRIAAHLAERYLNAWHNTGFYDFDRNGEGFVLRQLAAVHGAEALKIWDVGAHHGDYAVAAHAMLPRAKVTSFEIVPAIAEALVRRALDPSWFTLKTMGLSDAPGTVEVAWNHGSDSTNTIGPSQAMLDHDEVEMVTCPVTTVDALLAEGTPSPDFLKIDVEGHEAAVLNGAQGLLASDSAPRLIQFEYGGTWIPSGCTLYEVQSMLERHGYSVGRLYADHVAFKRYDFSDERYRMGNMVATRSAEMRWALS